MDNHLYPLVLRLIGLLTRATPDTSEEELFWRYHFVTGGLLTLARTDRIHRLSGGLCRSNDFAAIKDRVARLMAAGLRELCADPDRSRDRA